MTVASTATAVLSALVAVAVDQGRSVLVALVALVTIVAVGGSSVFFAGYVAHGQSAEWRPTRLWLTRVALGIALVATAASATYALRSGSEDVPSEPVAGISKTCSSFKVFAQNRYQPVGAAIRRAPDVLAAYRAVADPNELVVLDGWVHGPVAYPTNMPPWNSDIWFHLADGRGWVSFAGVRGGPTELDPTGTSPDGGPVAPSPPDCQGSLVS